MASRRAAAELRAWLAATARSFSTRVSGARAASAPGGRPAKGSGAPNISLASLAVGGSIVLGGTAYFTYRYARAHAVLPSPEELGSGEGQGAGNLADSYRIFDQLADKYDDAIGQEEAALWYGMMRQWLLANASGDVLEISVGTGRNFKYYDLSKGAIRSLTCTDLSSHMLLRAEDKYFDELQLGEKHPKVRIKFCLADAHCLVEPERKQEDQPQVASGGSNTATGSRWWPWSGRPQPQSSPAPDATASPAGQATADPAAGAGAGATAADRGPAVDPVLSGRELPGLHAGGLLNFFRVLVPSSSSPSSPCSSPSTTTSNSSSQQPPAAQDASNGADQQLHGTGQQQLLLQQPQQQKQQKQQHTGRPSAQGTGTAHQHEEDVDACSCHAAAAGGAMAYKARCATGRLESGAALSRFPAHSFDTVVDTFGLCSHEDPVRVLRQMARVCKPGGKILLLQHGRSHYDWLNHKLDGSAAKHQRKWGCLWNKDILAIVEQAGLVVDKTTRWHFGTSYYIVARPPAPPRRA